MNVMTKESSKRLGEEHDFTIYPATKLGGQCAAFNASVADRESSNYCGTQTR